MSWESIKPVPKVTAAVVALAVTRILLWIAEAQFEWDIPEVIAFSLLVVVTALAGWFAPRVEA